MKIEAIRGQNLASLAGGFEVDFAKGPLAETGLFAIVGPTGAGKSTLLDALCLALFGKYPRQPEGKEKLLDVSGHEIVASSEENILSRGKAWGYAEVDFTGQDGQQYQARWEVKRANGKANGKLQKTQRSLKERHGGQVLAEKVTEVNAKVEEVCGLNFSQFKRTALLAQGQFDAFLAAKGDDRSALLERITGTEIYRRISQRVFELAREKRQSIEALDRQASQIAVMDAEAIAALKDEEMRLRGEREGMDAERGRLAAAIQLRSHLEVAEKDFVQAQARLKTAEDALVHVNEDRLLLEEVGRLEAARPLLEAARQARKQLAESEEEETRAKALCEKRNGECEEAARILAERERVHQDVATQVEGFLEPWRLAEEADQRVALQRQAFEQSEQQWAAVRTEAHQRSSAAEAARRESDRIEARLAAAKDWLRENAEYELWSLRMAAVESLVEARQKISHGLGEIADPAGERQRCAEEYRQVADEGIEGQRRLETSQPTEQQKVLASTDQELERLTKARKFCADAIEAEREKEAAEQQRDASEGKRLVAEGRKRQAELDLAGINGSIAESKRMLGGIEVSLNAAAKKLREQLAEGAPCPVCGSTEHPLHDKDEELQAQARELRQRTRELDERLKALNAELSGAGASAAAEESRRNEAVRKIEACEARIAEANRGYEALLPHLPPEVPAKCGQSALAVIQQRCGVVEESRRVAREKWEEGQQAQERLNKLNDTRVALQARLSQLDALAANTAQWTPLMAGTKWTLEAVDGKLESWVAELRQQVAVHASRKEEAAGQASQAATAREQASACEAQAAQVVASLAAKQLEWEAAREKDEAAKVERQGMLGGEATQVHRNQWIQRQQAVQQELAGARSTYETALALESAAREGLHQKEKNRVERAEARARAKGAFERACENAGVDWQRARQVLEISDLEQRRVRVQLAQQSLHSAKGVAEQAAQAARNAADKCADLQPMPLLESAVAEAGRRLGEIDQRLGAIEEKKQSEAKALANRMEIEKRIKTAKDEYQSWEEVNVAIGSASGDKFQRAVQGVTLEHLVQLANRHLRLIAPRFELSRSKVEPLGLIVIDQDMGGVAGPASSLSGGEKFLVSLALALGLSSLEGRESFVDSLFIDEGFGSLDPQALDLVMAALEALPGSGKRVGVISHVEAMKERIAVQVQVVPRGAGRSTLQVVSSQKADWAMYSEG